MGAVLSYQIEGFTIGKLLLIPCQSDSLTLYVAYSWGASWNLWPTVQDCVSFLPKYLTFTHTCIKTNPLSFADTLHSKVKANSEKVRAGNEELKDVKKKVRQLEYFKMGGVYSSGPHQAIAISGGCCVTSTRIVVRNFINLSSPSIFLIQVGSTGGGLGLGLVVGH